MSTESVAINRREREERERREREEREKKEEKLETMATRTSASMATKCATMARKRPPTRTTFLTGSARLVHARGKGHAVSDEEEEEEGYEVHQVKSI